MTPLGLPDLNEPMDLPAAIGWLKGRASTRCEKPLQWSLDDVRAVKVIAQALAEFDVEALEARTEAA